MADTLTKSDEPRRLSQWLRDRQPWSLADRLLLIQKLATQVRTLHESGRTHCAITVDEVLVDGEFEPQLGPPAPLCRFGGEHSDPDLCPPELAGGEVLELPPEIERAAAILHQCGHRFDSRRIDVYQLGSLLCVLSTGRSVLQYMYSSRAKASVPRLARSLLSRALGCDDVEPLADCDEFLEALEDVLQLAGSGHTSTSILETPAVAEGRTFGAGMPAAAAGTGGERGRAEETTDALPFERLGHFRIIRRIGRGGMGDVYLAQDELLDRRVALKVLAPRLARDKAFVRRFQTEASAAAKVVHANVVPVHLNGEDAGHHFFAMQFIEGQSLDQYLALQPRPTLEESLRIVEQCLAGLAAAHQQGLIHRDIKPSNILIERETGRAVLVDFGLVQIEGKNLHDAAPGTVMGTVDYIAPEQVRGRQADHRTDLYALGVLLYRLLSGRLPFEGTTPEDIALQHAYEEPLPLKQAAPDVPRRVSDIVHRLIARNRTDRYSTCMEVLADIQAFRKGRPVNASAESWEKTTTRLPMLTEVGGLAGVEEALEPARPGWWRRLGSWVGVGPAAHTSQLVQIRQSVRALERETKVCERRRDELAQSLDEACSVEADLSRRIQTDLAHAADAAQEAESATDTEERLAALTRKQQYEENAEMTRGEKEEQLHLIEELDRQLGEVDATIAQLHSQCDVLKSRLREAGVAAETSGVSPPPRRRRGLRITVAACGLLALVLLPAVGIWLWPDSHALPPAEPPPAPEAFMPLNEAKEMFDSKAPNWTVQNDGDGEYLTGMMGGDRWPTRTKAPCQASAVEFGFKVKSERHHLIHMEIDGVRYSYSRGHWNNLGTQVLEGDKEDSLPGIVASPDEWCSQAVTLKDDVLRFYYQGEYVWGATVPEAAGGTHVVHVGFGSHNTTVSLKDFFLQHR